MMSSGKDTIISSSIFTAQLLFCAPYTLKTVVGRLWWITCAIMLLGGIGAVLLGIHNPLGWLVALVTAGAYALGVCLRWRPPKE